MIVNGCTLPELLADALTSGRFHRERGVWELKDDKDAYGNPLETELGDTFESLEELERETANLSDDFPSNEHYGQSSAELAGPGAIADITDFSRIVCFANSGDGAPFCLDFRESSTRPSVIWWDDCYWRRVAPDVESFMVLFDFDAADPVPAVDASPEVVGKSELYRQMARKRFVDQSKGPPCPECGQPLRTPQAQQCFSCGASWHKQSN